MTFFIDFKGTNSLEEMPLDIESSKWETMAAGNWHHEEASSPQPGSSYWSSTTTECQCEWASSPSHGILFWRRFEKGALKNILNYSNYVINF